MQEIGTPQWWANLVTYIVFSFFGGCIGLDRFYKGQIGWGVIKFITLGGLIIWYAIDVIRYGYRLGKTGQWLKSVGEDRG